ncbi:unnamed protein product [Thelazia callipaeda]|uniref:AAA_16 domain-containing protein n=1 Tax=Thelazia callipaeda TaxID=103827 RepID=A0A0N5D743_THECL|nr:unnamed protein product [Thelazia callipaeda]
MVKRRKRPPLLRHSDKQSSCTSNKRLKTQESCSENNPDFQSNLYGREKEVATLSELLHDAISNHSPASIFVSGPPGTGKTLAVKLILRNMTSLHE